MGLKIQSKLYLGFSFLFLLIVIIWIFSSIYIFKLSSDSDAMLKENYKSLVAMKYSSVALDQMKDLQSEYFFNQTSRYADSSYQDRILDFEKSLHEEENNITEAGEQELVVKLSAAFYQYVNHFNAIRKDSLKPNQSFYFDILQDYKDVKRYVEAISDLNMAAIIKKNGKLKETSNNAFFYISIIGTIFFLLSFSILMNFPRNIAEPVKELTRGIQEIARKNYNQQLYIKSTDEFGELAQAFNKMVFELNAFEKSNLAQILYEKKRIEAIISNMRDAIIGLDESKRIIFANPVACELLGIASSALVGQHISDVSTRNDLFKNILADLLNGSYKTKDFNPLKIVVAGKESYFTKEIADVLSESTESREQQLIGHLITLKNITKFQELDEAKTNFIATVSHELKNPISSANLNMKLLEDERIGKLNEEQHILIRNAREEVNRLLKITSELLDLSQVETGNIKIRVQPTDPRLVMEFAIDAVKSQAMQRKVIIREAVEDNIPWINADIEKTAWVMINLLTNSIQYSDENSRIDVSVNRAGEEVRFSVKDHGKGIDPKYLDKIFERFFRVPGSIHAGTGLGLAISKEFIIKQKGRIWAESSPGEGSTFYFTLPVVS